MPRASKPKWRDIKEGTREERIERAIGHRLTVQDEVRRCASLQVSIQAGWAEQRERRTGVKPEPAVWPFADRDDTSRAWIIRGGAFAYLVTEAVLSGLFGAHWIGVGELVGAFIGVMVAAVLALASHAILVAVWKRLFPETSERAAIRMTLSAGAVSIIALIPVVMTWRGSAVFGDVVGYSFTVVAFTLPIATGAFLVWAWIVDYGRRSANHYNAVTRELADWLTLLNDIHALLGIGPDEGGLPARAGNGQSRTTEQGGNDGKNVFQRPTPAGR